MKHYGTQMTKDKTSHLMNEGWAGGKTSARMQLKINQLINKSFSL